MQLIETYALSCGLKIGKPFIYEQFFPCPWDKYIILHAGGGMDSKKYDYYQEVIEILKPHLPDFTILQIGSKNEKYINGCVNLLGQTNIHQTAYLIKNSALILGNDSCNVHIASGFGVPIVSLYGSTTPYNHGPSFSKNFCPIEADRNGNKPSYSSEEHPKVINNILPEKIAKSVLSMLGLNPDLITRETIHIGRRYNYELIEVVPDMIVPGNFFPNYSPTIRMDYLFDEGFLVKNLSNRTFRIITDKPISKNILAQFKGRILSIVYDIPKNFSVDFVGLLQKSGIDFTLVSLLKDAELADAKMAMFDYGIILERAMPGKQFLETKKESLQGSLKYKTNKILLSKNNLFLNYSDYKDNLPSKSINDRNGNLRLEESLFDFEENLYIYRE